MAPIVYARHEDRVADRIGGRLMLAGLVVAGALLLALWLLGLIEGALEPLSLGILVLFIVSILSGLLVMAFHSAQGERDWLRLDANGLTLSRRGHQAQWHWSRVAAVRSYAWWHPLGLLLGESLRIDLAGGGRLKISDDYFTPLKEILGHLRDTRARALGLGGLAGVSIASITAPALVSQGPKIFRRQGIGWGRLDVAALSTIGIAAAFVLIPAAIAADWSDVREWSRTLLGTMVTFLFSTIYAVPTWIRGATAAGNFLLLSDDGLHLRHEGRARHWRWPDVSGFALVREEADPEAGKEQRRVITFATRGSGGARAGPADGEVQEIVIEEVYDGPLEEILRRLEAWHAWAGTAEAETAAEDPGAEALLSVKRRPGGGEGVLGGGAVILGLGISLLATAVFIGLIAFLAHHSRGIQIAILAAGVLLVPAPIFLSSWLATRFSLQADRKGMTYRRLGMTRRWAWDQLSSAELSESAPRWTETPRRLLLIGAEQDDRLSRLTRWAYRLGDGRPLIVIEDIFDQPLHEIAQRLEILRRDSSATGRRAA